MIIQSEKINKQLSKKDCGYLEKFIYVLMQKKHLNFFLTILFLKKFIHKNCRSATACKCAFVKMLKRYIDFSKYPKKNSKNKVKKLKL